MAPTVFREGEVEVDGHRLRYVEAGGGPALVHLAGERGLRLTPAHDLLAARFRVLVFEPPAADRSADGRERTAPAIASGLARATERLGVEGFDLLGSSSSAAAALELAMLAPARVRALVLEAPRALDLGPRDAELGRRLSGLTTPTLVLLGTEDGGAPGGLGGADTALIPGSHLVLVYAAGHAIAVDRPEAFAEVVVDFLERHEAFVISRARSVILP